MNQRTDDKLSRQEQVIYKGSNFDVIKTTEGPALRISVGGHVIVMTAEKWHEAAHQPPPAATGATPETGALRAIVRNMNTLNPNEVLSFIERVCASHEQLERERDDARRELAEANLTIRYERDRNLQKVQEARLSSTGAPSAEAIRWAERMKHHFVEPDTRDAADFILHAVAPTDDAGSAATGDGAKR